MSNGVVHGELTLFDCPRVRKSEYWQFIKLVAPHAQPPENQTHWLSQDATDAYCLRCSKMFRFTKGSSNSVRRHMERYHRKELLKRQLQAAQDAKKVSLVGAKKSGAVAANATPPRRNKRALSAQDAELLGEEAAMLSTAVVASGIGAGGVGSVVAIPVMPTAPKRHRVDAAGSSRHGVESLVKWLALSLRPFSIVDDAGFSCFAEAISGEQPFVVPTREALRHRLELMSENARFEVKQKLKKDVGHYALSAEIWRARVADADASTTVDSHATIKCWYLSEEFAMQSLVLDGVPIESLSPERLCQLLQDCGLVKTSMSLLLVPEGCKLQQDAATAGLRHITDVAESLDALVRNSLQKTDSTSAPGSREDLELSVTDDAAREAASHTVQSALQDVMQFITWIRTDAIAHAKLEQLFPSVPLELARFPALEPSDWSLPTAHDVITRAIALRASFDGLVDRWSEHSDASSTDTPPEKVKPLSWMLLEGLVILWRPLHEVVQVTTNEKVCSLPFMLPILTMAKQLFERATLFDDLKQRHAAAASSDVPEATDLVAAALATLQSELLGGLNRHFGALCSSLPWISALDPRYARLRHLSDDERELCRQQLLEHAAELYSAQLPPLPTQTPAADPLGSLTHADFDSDLIYGDARASTAASGGAAASMPGLMHRLLYDEEEDLPASADAALTREAEIAQARLYIASEIATYFNEHQLRKTRIACPLQWWSAHRERFSFLAPLARLWLSTRASLAASSAQDHVLSSELCESLGNKETKEHWAKLAGDLIVLRAHLQATPTGSVSL